VRTARFCHHIRQLVESGIVDFDARGKGATGREALNGQYAHGRSGLSLHR
jgi:hypothetical protein